MVRKEYLPPVTKSLWKAHPEGPSWPAVVVYSSNDTNDIPIASEKVHHAQLPLTLPNIGSPHGRPTIKPASSASQPANPSTKAAEDVLKRPLSPPLSRLRRAQQALVGRRKRRVVSNRNSRVRVSFAHSTSSSGLRPSGTRTSVQKRNSKAGPRVGSTQWIAGLDTPRRRDADPSPPVRSGPEIKPIQQSVIPPQDKPKGAPANRAVQYGRDRHQGEFSLMQVPQAPGHYVASSARQPEYAHVGALDGSSSTEAIRFPRNNAKRHASYVARAPPPSRSARPVGRPRQQDGSIPSRAIADDRLATLGPLAEESLSRGLSQKDCLSCLISPTKNKALPIPPSGPPQTREQSKNLARFTKQLQRYSSEINANGKPGLLQVTPTVSDSPTTLDTVSELLPYHKQFKAAGLAVTSREQMPRIPESTYQRRIVTNNRKEIDEPMVHVQVDGSTVTPSEQESNPEEPAVQSSHENEAGSSSPRVPQQAPNNAENPVNKGLLPWLRKNGRPTAVKSHSNRKFSVDHIHPSQATAADPYLTPSDKLGIIDAYFNSPTPAVSQSKQPEPKNPSSSSSSPHRASSVVDTPRRKEPPAERRPVPRRSLRRHMKDTSQWPTAGVLIHNKSPSPEDHENQGSEVLAGMQERPPVPAKDLAPGRDQPCSTTERVRKSAESRHRPPLPPKVSHFEHSVALAEQVEDKPATPPKDLPATLSQSQVASRHHTDKSMCKPWSRVTVLRRKSHARSPPVPATIREETEATTEQKGKTNAPNVHDVNTAPQIPDTWTCAVGRSSSFEQALDAVIQKLDDMDERRKYERKIELEAAQQAAAKLEASQELVSNYGSPSGQVSRRQTEGKVGSPGEAPSSATNESAAHLDRDIDDRDVLLGLKMAICAACDEDLDAWIRDRTGLRLRRFLADLKAFDAVSRDRKPAATRPPRRQARRTPTEDRRLNAERERRRQSTKSKALKGHCFGEDG